MTALESQLAKDRAVRDAARAVFDARLGQVRRALGERSIPQRVVDEATGRAMAAADEGLAIAKDGKWVLAATALALLAWVLRRPLLNSACQLYEQLLNPEPASRWARLRDWTKRKVIP
ncbi:hypothetical protein ACFOD9_08865 [Novosphingobium bradum]|uniref:DUF3618 domain-containing protein n=1 Tax=Novosphingobium bradum TaxID=1737444 RepID=A0ABV7IQV0_9SPHN